MDISPDLVAVATSQLAAKRANLPKEVALGSQAREIDNLIDEVGSRIGLDLSRFKFQASDFTPVNPEFVGRIGDTHRVVLNIYAERIDAVLTYLRSLLPPERVSRIGF